MPAPGQEETVRIVALDRDFHVHCYRCEVCGIPESEQSCNLETLVPSEGLGLIRQASALTQAAKAVPSHNLPHSEPSLSLYKRFEFLLLQMQL